MAAMPSAARDTFLRESRIAKLVTLREDGAPTVQPVWFEWDGATAAIFTDRSSAKVARIQRDPRVALTVETGVGVPEAWVTVEGTATIEPEGGMELARRLAQRYYAPGAAATAIASWEQRASEWVVIRITPTRIGSLAE
ncbi:MAG: PPOX class F420-dependent oxidoreductase [Dehalococcoidia bacterium]|nr:PPOX class F420-dependent oxidoreductase [Dehalococcoidia bacterium]